MTILLSGVTLTTMTLAKQEELAPACGGGEGCVVPVRPYYRPQMMYGFGVNKEDIGNGLEVEQVVFLKLDYPARYYLIIGDDIYKMEEVHSKYDWQTGTKVIQYSSEEGDVMTVIIQNFDYGSKGISAEFKEYLITFYAGYQYPRPVPPRPIMETETAVIEEKTKPIRPVPHITNPPGIVKKVGIGIEELFTEMNPITEWVE